MQNSKDWPDMRENFKAVSEGDSKKLAEGEWCIYRFHKKGILTPNWSPTADEAIGGSKFVYQDYVTRLIWRPVGLTYGLAGDMSNPQGVVDKGGYLIFMKWDISNKKIKNGLVPQIGDSVFTILNGDQKLPPKTPFKIIERFKIQNFEKSRDTYGQSSGWILNVIKDTTTD